MKLRSASLSDIGKVRLRNEDRCLLDEEMGIFGVADGVGGMPFGAEAAQTARDTILKAFRDLPRREVPHLVNIVHDANRAVAARGRVLSHGTGIATTLTFGSFRETEVTIAHVGDSRAYAWHQGEFTQLTRDHTVEREGRRLQALATILQLSPGDRHALTRCLGPADAPEVDLVIRTLEPADRFLFCTDGLTNHVRGDEIAVLTRQAKEPAIILQELVALALRRGGSDNISGVLVVVD